MSDTPKARIELAELVKLLLQRDLPKPYVIKRIEYAMLFMFKDKDPPISIVRPVLGDFVDSVMKTEVESVFNQLKEIEVSERDQEFIQSVREDFDEYGSLTAKQWPVLVKIKNKYEKGLGVV